MRVHLYREDSKNIDAIWLDRNGVDIPWIYYILYTLSVRIQYFVNRRLKDVR